MGLQIPLSCFLGCPSISYLPSAKVRQSPSWHKSPEQEDVPMPGTGHIHADPRPRDFQRQSTPTIAQSPGAPIRPQPHVPGAQPAREEAQSPLSCQPWHFLSCRRQPTPFWGVSGFPKAHSILIPFSSPLHGFVSLSRSARAGQGSPSIVFSCW